MHIKVGPTKEFDTGRTNRYFLVSDFVSSDKSHWEAIRETAKGCSVERGKALMVAFLALGQHYELSPINEDIGAPYQSIVIAQYVVTIHGKQLFFSDPFGFGKFEEPGPVPEDFQI